MANFDITPERRYQTGGSNYWEIVVWTLWCTEKFIGWIIVDEFDKDHTRRLILKE